MKRLNKTRHSIADALEFVAAIVRPTPKGPMDVMNSFKGNIGEFASTMVIEGSDLGALSTAMFAHCTLWMLGQARGHFGRHPMSSTQRYKFNLDFDAKLKRVEEEDEVDEDFVVNCDAGVQWIRDLLAKSRNAEELQ